MSHKHPIFEGQIWSKKCRKSHVNTFYDTPWLCHCHCAHFFFACGAGLRQPCEASALKWPFTNSSQPFPQKNVMKMFRQLLKTCSLHSMNWAASDLVGLGLPSSVELWQNPTEGWKLLLQIQPKVWSFCCKIEAEVKQMDQTKFKECDSRQNEKIHFWQKNFGLSRLKC